MYGETLHEDEGPDSKEIFDLGFTRPLSGQPFTGPNILPDARIAPAFATAHYTITIQEEVMGKVTPKLVRALALALGQEATFFALLCGSQS
jgi:isopenicillin N synthase-like dioxygenase